jgi:hypothetical protein
MARRVGAPKPLLARWDRRGSAGCFIGLENAPASYWAAAMSPKWRRRPNSPIGRHTGSAGGDALTTPYYAYI